ncbi:Extensin-like protein [Chondromyces apiculatus DSM 436]|uniref:Extensin-like protein n=1 Tax=Chondromyces apiculatus DSM 436 TaxID=1192034 RepID=A0A017T9U8_9BACT|nr:Extensin-like protein [Chondromyces apiculatus DSM 436]
MIAVLVAVLAGALPVMGKPKVRYQQGWAGRPWARHAAMSGPQCLAELERRGVRAVRAPAEGAQGVMAPVRLPEGAGRVMYRTAAPAHVRARQPGDVMDCRMALSLAEFSKVLRAHGVVEVQMASAYRPARALGTQGARGVQGARGGQGGAVLEGLGLRHAGGLAVDVLRFGKEGGKGALVWLDVEHDFGGTLGAPVCGAGQEGLAGAAKALRALICEAAARHLFTSILTPNYDRAHKNHVHLEVTPGVQWELLR